MPTHLAAAAQPIHRCESSRNPRSRAISTDTPVQSAPERPDVAFTRGRDRWIGPFGAARPRTARDQPIDRSHPLRATRRAQPSAAC
jgi:hypothetical protein